jgi:hypothetical protein
MVPMMEQLQSSHMLCVGGACITWAPSLLQQVWLLWQAWPMQAARGWGMGVG